MNDMVTKWGPEIAKRGFTQIPNYLINVNSALHEDYRISPSEFVILIQLISNWWKKEEMPFPSMRTLAIRSGISERQVQRALKALEEKQFIKKVKGKVDRVIASNSYDLSPLVETLVKVAEHFPPTHPRKVQAPKEKESKSGRKLKFD